MNLFWKNANWWLEDKHLLTLDKGPFKREYPAISLSPGVTLIRGPRQIGKSTWMKFLLKKHSQMGNSCFFYSCEDLNDHKDLSALIDSYPEVEFYFLDEVTFVKEWWRSIKKATDSSLNKKFILTGSNSYDLKFGLDLMPGRWAKGTGEMFLLPMDFDEWCEMRSQAKWPQLSRLDGLRLYMKTGGFPTALAESGAEGKYPAEAIKIYRRWIEGDVVKLKRQPQYMMELIGQIAKSMGSSLSMQTLAKNTQMMSYHTAQDYISILEHAFAVRVLYAYNPEKDTFQMKKDKKLYFTDPLIYWVALDWSGIKTPEHFESQLAETIVCEKLMRRTKRIGYYSDQNGEVDFVSAKDWAIEVKWAPTTGNLSKAFKNLLIANKKVWTQENFLL